MASKKAPARSALSNLSVNTCGTPTKSLNLGKESLPRKRRIDDVEEPENAQTACKVLISPRLVTETVSVARADSRDYAGVARMRKAPTSEITPASIEKQPSSAPMPEEAPSPYSTVSSPLDYDPDDTMESQQTAATELTQPLTLDQMASVAGSSRVSQHAETLRLRLRLAQFKVKTNQINIPFSQLRLSTTASQSPNEKTQRRPSSTTFEADTEDAEAEVRRKQKGYQPNLPHLLPSAEFTSLSSRLSSVRSPVVPAQDLSSSPPKSTSTEERENVTQTPVLPKWQTMARNEGPALRDNGTSSVVKGKAAALGLLELRGEH